MSRKPSILIVDDEVNVARTLKMVFEHEGYEATTAHSCAEALELLSNSHVFDIVMTDLNMEKEDIGLEVARKAMHLKPRPVVVICTGFASTFNASAALKIQVDYLATKPADLKELTNALNRLVMLRRASGKGGA
ncbi:MAG TPA: response regulator [Terriglobales bacterium]|nr:response regulator [Terriglobales bacterium]